MSDDTNKKIAHRIALAEKITKKHGPAKAASTAKLDEVKAEYGAEAFLSWLVMADFA